MLPIFEEWEQKSKTPLDNNLFHGWSIESLCEQFKYNFFAALLTLDWVVKNPDEALPALEKKMYIITKNNES